MHAKAPLLDSKWWLRMGRRGAPQRRRLEPGVHVPQKPLGQGAPTFSVMPAGPLLPSIFSPPGTLSAVHGPARHEQPLGDRLFRHFDGQAP